MNDLITPDSIDIRKSLDKVLRGSVVATAIFNIPEELRVLSEEELIERFPKGRARPLDTKLRTAFWSEYANAVAGSRTMNMSKVWGGVCSREHLYERILADKERLAFITLPPVEVSLALREAAPVLLTDFREAWDVAFQEFKTTKDPKMFEVMRKSVEMILLHTQGAPIHRVEQKNLNVNMTGKEASDAGVTSNIKDIDAQLRELEESLGGDVVEVTGTRLENNDDKA